MLTVSEAWRAAHPGGAAGILVMGDVVNPPHHSALERRIAEVEIDLRATFGTRDRAAPRALPIIQAYDAYYRRHKKTYHVQLQLESVALRRLLKPGMLRAWPPDPWDAARPRVASGPRLP